MPVERLSGSGDAVAVEFCCGKPRIAVGPAHGFLFMVYLALTFDLARRANWSFLRMVLVMLAGTIPFLSFWAERKVTHEWIADNSGVNSDNSESDHALKA